MIRRRNSGQFSSNVDLAAKRITIDHTVNDFCVYVNNRHITCNCYRLFSHIVIAIPSPYSYGNAYERIVKRSAECTVALNCNGKDFRNCVVIQGCLEAVCHNSAFEFPSIRIVKLDLCNQLVNTGKVSNVDINVVDRLCLGCFAGVIMTAKSHNCITGYRKGAGDLHGVTKFILHFKRNGMCTGNESNVALGGKHITVDRRFNNHTVNCDLTGSKVKSSVIGNSCRECNIVTIDCRTVFKRNSSIGSRISGGSNGRQNSVINSGAVVKSDIINVESNYVCRIGFYVSTNERRRTGVTFIGCNRCAEIVVLRNINSRVYPTRFGDICIAGRVEVGLLAGCGRSKHKVILLAGVSTVSILGIKLRLECKAFTRCRECILGNVKPHTESGRLHAVGNVAENDSLTHVKEYVIRPACKSSIGIVKSPGKSVVTVSYLTAVRGGSNKGFTAQIFIELTGKRFRANKRIVDAVVLRPLLGFFKAHEASLIAIFKVPNNFGTLTEFDYIGQFDFAVSDRNVNTCNRCIVGGCEIEAIKSTCSIVRKCNRNRIGIYINICFACHSNDGKLDRTNLIGRRVRNRCGGCRKFEHFRVSNRDRLCTNHFSAGNNLNIDNALFTVRNKLAVCNSTKGIIGKCPCSVSGHIHSIAVSINCFRAKCISCLRCEDIIISFNIYNVKFTGRSNVGSNENTVSGRTLRTVARNRAHFKFFFTNALGNECRRTAAVAVSSPLTTKSEHSFAFFVGTETNRVVSATTVVHNENESTVFLNTNHRTSGIIRSAALFGIYECAILNNHSEGYTYRMEKGTFCEIVVNLILVECLNVAGNVAFRILKYVKNGLSIAQSSTAGSYVFSCITDPLAVVDKYTGRVGAVVKVGIHTTNNVVSEGILVILSHFGEFLMRPVCLIFQIFVDLIVSGNNGYVRVGRVNFNDMKNLSACTRGIIEYNFGLNSCTGNEYVIFLGDYVVITVCTKTCAVKDNVVLFPVRNRCKGSHRERTHKHDNGNYKSNCTSCFRHTFSPFPKT